ncbi:hypothetical protein EVAR_11348_1 [Eumeta japonica]|uniref:Uncharacterized protein n=1 Tax=Eumeta variegata TaxID=151549 RepID=A0A4C1U152_EUMVA|nr:hypothetical protein EVAR_11348_1 [Eumeta japonica]
MLRFSVLPSSYFRLRETDLTLPTSVHFGADDLTWSCSEGADVLEEVFFSRGPVTVRRPRSFNVAVPTNCAVVQKYICGNRPPRCTEYINIEPPGIDYPPERSRPESAAFAVHSRRDGLDGVFTFLGFRR